MKPQSQIKYIQSKHAEASPIKAAEFDASMHNLDLESPADIAVAVSGGPDSMALAFCAERWLGKQGKLLALIVDHGLRADSADEARRTQVALKKRGIESEILTWQHSQIISRLHEVARKARYRLLTEACHRHSMRNLLLAHHSQDQAETILMRLAKGSGIDGLAGIPARNVLDNLQILRPFLGFQRDRLIATCKNAGLPFVSDPSNEERKFARGRLRRILPLLAEEGLTVERLNDLGARAAEAKVALDHAAAMLIRAGSTFDDAGVIHLKLEYFRSAPQAIARRALAICLQIMHPENYAPEYVSLTRLSDALIADVEMTPCTLHGCLIGKNEARASIMREVAAIAHAPVIKPGENVVWDDRWQVSLRADAGQDHMVRPLGNPPHETLDRLAPGLRKHIPQGRVRAALPSLWLNGALALIPALPRSPYRALADAKPAFAWPPPLPY